MTLDFGPEFVASSFIKQFYETLSKNPGELHRFYKDESYFTHCDGQMPSQSCSGVDNIRRRVTELNLAGSKVDLSEGSLDAHCSENNGVIVVATGLFTPRDSNVTQPFVQTFFLSAQSNDMIIASYFLRNSIFRIIGPSLCNATDPPAVVEVVDDAKVLIEESVAVELEVQEPLVSPQSQDDLPASIDKAAEQEVVDDSEDVDREESFQENTSIDEVASASEALPPPVESPQLQRESKPKSWLDAVKKSQDDTPAPQAAVKTSSSKGSGLSHDKVKNVTRPGPIPSSVAGPQITASPQYTAASRGPPRSEEHRLKHSVYIRNVNEQTNERDLRTAFSVYGNIVQIDVRPKDLSRGFAFVEFDTVDSVKTVLNLPEPIQVRGHSLVIQERNVTSSSSSKPAYRKPRSNGRKDEKSSTAKFIQESDK